MREGQIHVLGISGSLRTDSYNRKVLRIAKRTAEELGAEVSEVDLRELAMPVYDADIQAKGFPESVLKFKRAVESADVLLIASPEYNASVSGALKNAIDWASRGTNSFDGKVAAIFGASPSALGTVRSQLHLRHILADVNVLVVPKPNVFIHSAQDAFDSSGALKNEGTHTRLKEVVARAIELARRLK